LSFESSAFLGDASAFVESMHALLPWTVPLPMAELQGAAALGGKAEALECAVEGVSRLFFVASSYLERALPGTGSAGGWCQQLREALPRTPECLLQRVEVRVQQQRESLETIVKFRHEFDRRCRAQGGELSGALRACGLLLGELDRTRSALVALAPCQPHHSTQGAAPHLLAALEVAPRDTSLGLAAAGVVVPGQAPHQPDGLVLALRFSGAEARTLRLLHLTLQQRGEDGGATKCLFLALKSIRLEPPTEKNSSSSGGSSVTPSTVLAALALPPVARGVPILSARLLLV